MWRIIVVNLLLFTGCIVLFMIIAGVIGYTAGPTDHTKEVAYVALWMLHLYLNIRWLKKRNMATLRYKVVSTILITFAYVTYILYVQYLYN